MIDTGELYKRVMEKLKFEPSLDASNITVAVKEDGIVILGGKVKSFTEKYTAEEAVKKIESVKGVANELEIDLSTIYKRSDADIAQAAITALKWTIFVPYEKIKITVEKGRLTLSGEVEFNYQKERAEKVVRDLYGVTEVINNIKVKPSVTPAEVKDKILKEFERNAKIDASNIQIDVVNGSEVILKGKVKNFDEDKEARDAAWSVPGVSKVIDELSITW